VTGDRWSVGGDRRKAGTRCEETKNGCGLRAIKEIVIGYQ